MADFVGAGWAFPLGVNGHGSIALARGEQELEQAMRLILSTYPGERPMRPEFGCRLRDHVFAGITTDTAALVADAVRTALLRWEPRVEVRAVDARVEDRAQGLLTIEIQYTVKETNDHRNLVFPFYTIPDDGSDY